jgi:hypothetical protein
LKQGPDHGSRGLTWVDLSRHINKNSYYYLFIFAVATTAMNYNNNNNNAAIFEV